MPRLLFYRRQVRIGQIRGIPRRGLPLVFLFFFWPTVLAQPPAFLHVCTVLTRALSASWRSCLFVGFASLVRWPVQGDQCGNHSGIESMSPRSKKYHDERSSGALHVKFNQKSARRSGDDSASQPMRFLSEPRSHWSL
ncbi:hypothetical protein V8C26DRAFT_412555 [Trichoderma gracile]